MSLKLYPSQETNPAKSSDEEIVRGFYENGFALVPGVLSLEEVQRLRNTLRPLFDRPEEERYTGDTNQYLFDIFSRYEALRFALFKPRTVEIITKILGETPAVVRECAAQFKNYSGWHKDTTALERGGQTFHKEEGYLMMGLIYYLQDNDPKLGGGLDVEPGSHKKPDRYAHAKQKPKPKASFLDRLLGRDKKQDNRQYGYDIADIENCYTIPSKAGDLILFDYKIDHRATPKGDDNQEKMAVMASFARDNKYLAEYHNYIGHRADYHYLKDFSIPTEFADQARQAGLTLV